MISTGTYAMSAGGCRSHPKGKVSAAISLRGLLCRAWNLRRACAMQPTSVTPSRDSASKPVWSAQTIETFQWHTNDRACGLLRPSAKSYRNTVCLSSRGLHDRPQWLRRHPADPDRLWACGAWHLHPARSIIVSDSAVVHSSGVFANDNERSPKLKFSVSKNYVPCSSANTPRTTNISSPP